MHLTFKVTDTARPAVNGLYQLIVGDQAKQAVGIGLRKELRTYLRAKGPNKRGFPSTGFYKSAAESITAPEVESDGVTISITQIGMRQRYLGGPILPKDGKKYLTIPAQGFAYGRLAGEFSGDVKFAFARNEEGFLCPALVAGEGGADITGAKPRLRKKGEPPKPAIQPDQVLFWLVKGVMQEPDPSVLPTEEEMTDAGRDALVSLVRSRLHDRNATVELVEDN